MTEHQIQSAFFDERAWRANQDDRWNSIYAIPNGGQRHPAVAAKLKKEGVKPGVPDVFVAVRCGGYGGLFIEFKIPKGRHSDSQLEWADRLSRYGYLVVTARSTDEGLLAVLDYFKGG